MEDIAAGILVVCVMIFVAPLLGVLAGAFCGWIVGFFWTVPILDFLGRLGMKTDGLTVWEIGAAMGFLGGFLKTNSSSSSSK